jgi:splicing factor 45
MRKGGSYSDSDYTLSEDEERPRKAGTCISLHHPWLDPNLYVGRYGETYDRWSRKGDNKDQDRDRGHDYDEMSMDSTPAPVAPADRDLTGDEAYQRRLAMSGGFRAPSPPPQDQPIIEEITPDTALKDETGEEAYLRRVAMSTMHRPQAQPISQPPPQQPQSKFPSPPPLAFNPFAPPSVPPPPPPPGIGGAPANPAIEEKKKAAAAIAAKLGALAALALPQPPPTSVESNVSPLPTEDAPQGYDNLT